MNPVIRVALLIGAILAVVIAGSYYYSRSLQPATPRAAGAPAGSPAPVMVGTPIEGPLAEGLQALQDNRLEEARASLEKVPLEDPGFLVALRNLAEVRAQLGDFAGARDALERLSSLQADTRGALELMSRVQYRLGDYQAAELALLRAFEIDDADPALRYDLALFRVAQARLPEAIETYDRAVARDPSQAGIMTALERLSALHEARPELPTVHYALAYFAKRLARPELEAEELEHFLAHESGGPAADAARRRLDELGGGRPR